MLRRGRVIIFIGLILALITAGLAYYLLQQGAPPPPEEEEIRTRPVVIALQDIEERTDILAGAVGTKEWPEDLVPANALNNLAQAVGKTALVPILKDQIILSEMLVDKARVVEEGTFAAFAIPEGKVAFAVPVDDVHTVAGAIQAGDFVDVLVTITFQAAHRTGLVAEAGTEEGAVAEVVPVQVLATQLTLQDVEVLRVGLWNVPPPPAPPAEGEEAPPPPEEEALPPPQNYLTLLIDQQDALVLKYARDDPNFNVDFALRGVGDHTIVSTESVTLEYVLRRFKVSLPAPPPTIGP